MNISFFSSIIAALVFYRLIEPAVDMLRGMLWGGNRGASGNGCAVAGGSLGARLDATRES